MAVQLDLNNPVFQDQWFALEKDDRLAVLNCCGKLAGREWEGIYRDKGLRWELIQSRNGPGGERLYSIRACHKTTETNKAADVLYLRQWRRRAQSGYGLRNWPRFWTNG